MFWKNQNFASRMEAAMSSLSKRNSAQVLENRDTTIGASEINACGRKVVMSKLKPATHGFSTLAKFFRGHRQEEFNAPLHRQIAIEEGLLWIPQLRVHYPSNPRLRAHVDNVYYASPTRKIEDATDICVVEEKNASTITAEPLDDYVAQLHFQMGLLHLNYPKASISGFLYQTDLNGDHTDYDGLIPLDMARAEQLINRGLGLLTWIDSKQIPRSEPSLKCGWCSFQTDCPSWKGEDIPIDDDMLVRFQKYYDLNQQISILCKQKDNEKLVLQQFLAAKGNKVRFVRHGLVVSLSQNKGRKSCSLTVLEEKYPDIAPQVITEGKPSFVLKVDYKPEQEVN